LGGVACADASGEAGRRGVLALRSALDRFAAELGVTGLEYAKSASTLFHPGRCASVSVNGQALGQVGELHPLVVRRFDIDGRVAALEIDVLPLLERATTPRVKPLPRFPAVTRDLAVVVEEAVTAADLLSAIRDAGGPLLESLTAFDEYRGEQVPEGSKSVAFGLTFRSPERTLTDAEVDALMEAIRSKLVERYGAAFRS
jgi:phenylalanyl-tRNA synthetase beta chain